MGSPDTELGRSTDEAEHDVTLTRNFWIMTTEITQQQFQDVMGYNPAEFNDCGPDCPVETVNWHEVAACTNELSRLEGLAACYECVGTAPDTIVCAPSGSYERAYDCPGYRLPTEAEWEYAARGGTTTATYNGNLLDPNATLDNGTCDAQAKLEPIAWWCGAVGADDLTHPVSGKAPNSYGLYDMLGNVWEWCHDWYGVYPGGAQTDPTGPPSGSYRVLRGGSSYHTARLARAACRLGTFPGSRASYDGARLVRSVL
jgi:formylglycine-generating enzyme required for sulfatase activity